MKIIDHLDKISTPFTNAVITIGNFDGVHIGHQALFHEVIEKADAIGGISVAAIFSWLFSWDEFTYALYLCLAEPTLPLKVYYYITRGSWFLTATYATIITIPVVIVTYSLQRFLKATSANALLILKSQSGGGTNTHALPTSLTSEFTNWLVTKSGDHSLKATVGKAQDTYSEMLPAYP